MLAINLEPDLARHVAELAQKSGLSVEALVHDAIERMIEDALDYAAAEAALEDYDPSTNISMEQMRRELGLEP